MKKKVTVCFRTSQDLRKRLEELAQSDRRSLSSLIELILTDYLNKERVRDQQERRRYPRKAVTIPAYVEAPDSTRHGAVVLDLSLNGIGISVPRECVSKIYEGGEKSQFETAFAVPDRNETVRLVCKPERVVPSGQDMYVGASLINADFGTYKDLQQFLMERAS